MTDTGSYIIQKLLEIMYIHMESLHGLIASACYLSNKYYQFKYKPVGRINTGT